MKTIDPSQLKKTLHIASIYTDKQLITILSKTSVDAFRELVQRSAKDTGYLRSNWDIAVDTTPPSGVLVNPNPSEYYTDPPTPNIDPKSGSIVTIYNNTEYAMYLEVGTPKMRAQPMIQPVSIYVERVLKQLARNLSQEVLDV